MEVTKFWTKGKIIFAVFILIIVASFISFSYIHKNKLKKEYIKLENLLTANAPYYMKLEKIELSLGEWREIDINDIFGRSLTKNEYSDDCKGYVIAYLDEDTENVDYKTYLKCGKIYVTKNYGSKLSSETKNTSTTQTQNDTTNPEIQLIGRETMSIKLGSTFKDPGVVAQDNIDGDITNKVKVKGEVDTSIEGTYVLTYTVKDKAGNSASLERTVEVKSTAEENTQDLTKPVISFKSEIVSTICTGEKLDISVNGIYGYSARDDVDGDITNNVKISGSTDIINTAGSYTITYTVSDKAGNKTTAKRSFNVRNCSGANTTVTVPNTSQNEQEGTEVKGVNATCPTNLAVGDTGKITPYVYPKSATDRSVKYTSSNQSVIKIDSFGNVKALTAGTSQITITSSSDSKVYTSCTITVN